MPILGENKHILSENKHILGKNKHILGVFMPSLLLSSLKGRWF